MYNKCISFTIIFIFTRLGGSHFIRIRATCSKIFAWWGLFYITYIFTTKLWRFVFLFTISVSSCIDKIATNTTYKMLPKLCFSDNIKFSLTIFSLHWSVQRIYQVEVCRCCMFFGIVFEGRDWGYTCPRWYPRIPLHLYNGIIHRIDDTFCPSREIFRIPMALYRHSLYHLHRNNQALARWLS